jgi:hypothetical protein
MYYLDTWMSPPPGRDKVNEIKLFYFLTGRLAWLPDTRMTHPLLGHSYYSPMYKPIGLISMGPFFFLDAKRRRVLYTRRRSIPQKIAYDIGDPQGSPPKILNKTILNFTYDTRTSRSAAPIKGSRPLRHPRIFCLSITRKS